MIRSHALCIVKIDHNYVHNDHHQRWPWSTDPVWASRWAPIGCGLIGRSRRAHRCGCSCSGCIRWPARTACTCGCAIIGSTTSTRTPMPIRTTRIADFFSRTLAGWCRANIRRSSSTATKSTCPIWKPIRGLCFRNGERESCERSVFLFVCFVFGGGDDYDYDDGGGGGAFVADGLMVEEKLVLCGRKMPFDLVFFCCWVLSLCVDFVYVRFVCRTMARNSLHLLGLRYTAA